MFYFATFVLAMFVTMVMIPPLITAAYKFGFVDKPDPRKVHKAPIPRVGGVAFIVGALVPVLLWFDLSREIVAYLLGGGIIIAFGLLDDRFDLGFKIKMLAQILGALVLVLYGGISVGSMPWFMGGADLPLYIAIPLTVFMITAVTNAVNFSDGLDGLAGGVMLLSFCGIALLAFGQQIAQPGMLSIALIGSVLGFLHFNSHPARLFMGDVGSQFLGYSIAVLSIWITQADGSPYALGLPLLLVGLPLIDIVVVTVRRVRMGSSPFAPDKTHVHHRLMELGLDHLESVLWIYILQVLLVGCAFLLRFSSDEVVVGAFAVLLLLHALGFELAGRKQLSFRSKALPVGGSAFAKSVNYFRREGGFPRLACLFGMVALTVFYIHGLYVLTPVGTWQGVLAAILLVGVIVVRIYVKNRFSEWLERVAYYMTAIVIVFSVTSMTAMSGGSWYDWKLGFFAVLAVVVLLGMHYAEHPNFSIRPLDVLVMVMVVALPQALSSMGLPLQYVFASFFLLVIFYSIEMLLITSTYYCGRQKPLKVLLLSPLAVIALRALLKI